ncbi:MAG: phosphopantetheine-binding protein [Hyphomicrobiales bacterium]|nr:phosphopantetheine-binding protein [Hyphomicrobiales bacterium]
MKAETSDYRTRLLDIIAREGLVDAGRLVPDVTLDELGIKSADVVMILMVIEEEFDAYIPVDDALSNAKTLEDLLNALLPHLSKSAA